MYYKLNGKEVVATENSDAFNSDRSIAKDSIGDARVSTVFLVIDHSFDGGDPVVFETMIFWDGNDLDNWCDRYTTYDDAVAGHAVAIDLVKAAADTK